MKNLTKKGIGALLGLFFFCLSSCNDFQEINTDPTRMTNINAASLLTQIIYNTGTSSRSYGEIGNYIGQYWTNTSLIDQRHRYDFKGSDSEDVYNSIYGTLYDIYDLKKRAQAEQLDDYLGAGLVLEVYLTTYLTDVFGPVPYSEAMQGDELNFTPKFDDQETIYRQNLDKLDQALGLMEVLPTGNFVRGGDAFYMGDMKKWRKFANSLKLRMLMKMVKVDPTVKSKIADVIAAGELISSASETCAIIYDGRFGLQSTTATGTAGSVSLGQTFAEELHNTLDPRRPFMANLGKDKNGLPVNVDAQGEPIYLGVPSGESPDIIRDFNGLAAPYTGLRGLRAPSVVLSHSEVAFYIAEAILKGYTSGDASAYYEAGIRSSCAWWGVEEADIVAHLAKPTVRLSNDTDVALQQVMREEYINFYYQGYDGWINYKRVGFPVLHVGSAMATDQIMKRMVYPPLIKAINAANYSQAVNDYLDHGDELVSGSWWFQ
ncbi:SusD-like starch-binding protein associating with outer membrane [Dyadobacter jejuensis]|uniref:SusD-like starch-binding protein associating with outer membrane n=1 Tax=Dyadobacter jejuensis TaxID=1082580 RepID=A0A316ASC6_9BACT|nr:SusD/RagB family nutrient-binding outer membrane lipoprotein [Dyadobacter jejuensis]PWJ60603.1 SusD-like starch-binding protein associating with outer membrane [Dyadobacter jejuensis]